MGRPGEWRITSSTWPASDSAPSTPRAMWLTKPTTAAVLSWPYWAVPQRMPSVTTCVLWPAGNKAFNKLSCITVRLVLCLRDLGEILVRKSGDPVRLGDAHRLPYFGCVVALAEFFQALRQACLLLFHRIQVEGWDAVKQTDGPVAK